MSVDNFDEDELIPQPVEKCDDILLDSMVINHILFALGEKFDKEEYDKNNPDNPYEYDLEKSTDIFQKIEKRLLECGSKLILLDRVQIETINMKKDYYKKPYTKEDIKVALSKLGENQKIIVNYADKEMVNARILCDAETYVDQNDKPLSLTDCILLKIHVTQTFLSRPASLLTQDNTLQKACKSEGRETCGIYGVGESYIQKQEQYIKNKEAEYKEKLMCVCHGCGHRQPRKKECDYCATPLKNLRKESKNRF